MWVWLFAGLTFGAVVACSKSNTNSIPSAARHLKGAPGPPPYAMVVDAAGTAATMPPNWTDNLIPDEHSSYINVTDPTIAFFFFAGVSPGGGGTQVLSTTDLQTYSANTGYSSPVFTNGDQLDQSDGECGSNDKYADTFDGQYSDPGTVVQDPTQSSGNLIMIYEGENHCRGGQFENSYYATVGMARSSDVGKSWPTPNPNPATRYPVIVDPSPAPGNTNPVGNSIPAAIVADSYLYVVYEHHDGTLANSTLQEARAQLGGNGVLTFNRLYQGSFSQPGVNGMGDDLFAGKLNTCTGVEHQPGIVKLDGTSNYVLTLECKNATTGDTGWYFATSTDLIDWSTLSEVAGSFSPVLTCKPTGNHDSFNGWYPTLVTLGDSPQHIGMQGTVLYANGCLTNKKALWTRHFTIAGDS